MKMKRMRNYIFNVKATLHYMFLMFLGRFHIFAKRGGGRQLLSPSPPAAGGELLPMGANTKDKSIKKTR